MKRLFAALAVLPLLTACEDDGGASADASAHKPLAEYVIQVGGSDVSVIEFRPAQDPDDTCLYVSPVSTWTGSAKDCFAASAADGQIHRGATGQAHYALKMGRHTMNVVEFSPRTAPFMNCVYMTPSSTWTGSTLTCTVR